MIVDVILIVDCDGSQKVLFGRCCYKAKVVMTVVVVAVVVMVVKKVIIGSLLLYSQSSYDCYRFLPPSVLLSAAYEVVN